MKQDGKEAIMARKSIKVSTSPIYLMHQWYKTGQAGLFFGDILSNMLSVKESSVGPFFPWTCSVLIGGSSVV